MSNNLYFDPDERSVEEDEEYEDYLISVKNEQQQLITNYNKSAASLSAEEAINNVFQTESTPPIQREIFELLLSCYVILTEEQRTILLRRQNLSETDVIRIMEHVRQQCITTNFS